MIRFARISSGTLSRDGIIVLAFSTGIAGGVALGLTVQSRPAPAADEPVPASEPARPRATLPAPMSLPADVLRVIDGDTFEARVHVWPGLDVNTKIRLRNIDAPELHARCADEAAKAQAARTALETMLAPGAVTVSRIGIDKYGGRVDALAAARDTPDISTALLTGGFARSYDG